MKNLILGINGGMPLTQDDLKWLQLALSEAIGNGLYLNGTNSYILSGVDAITLGSGNIGFTAGIAVVNGEVCVMDADTIGIDPAGNPPSTWVFEKVISYDATGSKTFGDTSVNDTYQIVKAKIVVDASPPADSVDYNSMQRQEALLAEAIQDQPLKFTKTIGFHKGTNVTLAAGVASLDNDGNSFVMSFTDGSTLSSISVQNIFYPNGTTIFIKLSGNTANAQITIAQGGGITTPGGVDYTYKSGDWVIFSRNGNWELIEQRKPIAPLNPILAAGILAIGNISAGGLAQTVYFPAPLPNYNYYVIGTIVNALGATILDNASIYWVIQNRAANFFTVFFNEGTASTQNFEFEWIVFAK